MYLKYGYHCHADACISPYGLCKALAPIISDFDVNQIPEMFTVDRVFHLVPSPGQKSCISFYRINNVGYIKQENSLGKKGSPE